ncbi:hypothetical protein BH11PSE14_BH11PSE14_16190 [soil metagenome]
MDAGKTSEFYAPGLGGGKPIYRLPRDAVGLHIANTIEDVLLAARHGD